VAVVGRRRRTIGPGIILEVLSEISDSKDRERKLYRLDDLVTADEVATTMRVSVDAVWQWQRRRESTQFPEPLIRSRMVWDRREIMDWANATGRIIHNRRTGSPRKGKRPKAVRDVRTSQGWLEVTR
jgi:hypothetical protein